MFGPVDGSFGKYRRSRNILWVSTIAKGAGSVPVSRPPKRSTSSPF